MKRKQKLEIHPLLQMIGEGFKVMRAYANGDSKCEVIMDRQPVSQHIRGPPSYEMILQTYQNMDTYFHHLGSVMPTKLPRLVYEYNDLVRLCEEKRKAENN